MKRRTTFDATAWRSRLVWRRIRQTTTMRPPCVARSIPTSFEANGTGGFADSSPDNGQLAPLPGEPVLTLSDVTCNQILFTWVVGANSDSIAIYRDGVQQVVVFGQNGNSNVDFRPDGTHSYYAQRTECGRGDTSNVLTVQRDQSRVRWSARRDERRLRLDSDYLDISGGRGQFGFVRERHVLRFASRDA